jgi:hypothetical protein
VVDTQRLYLLRAEATPQPCPSCRRAIHFFEAAGIAIDDFDFSKTDYSCQCPHCSAALEQIVPPFTIGPLWYWQLKADWLQEQLQKARAWDHQQKSA